MNGFWQHKKTEPGLTIKISVIITCFNDAEYLHEAIKSVEKSSEKRYEIIIVNDGSTKPDTLKILADFKMRGYLLIDQSNKGVSFARNFGIEQARGEYILTLDVDNKIRPNYLEEALKILEADPKIGVVYADYQMFGCINKLRKLPDPDLSELLYSNYIDACSVFRKKIWKEVGGFPTEELNDIFFEDWDFWLSIAERGWQFFHFSKVMFDYRKKETSRTTLALSHDCFPELFLKIYSKHIKLVHQQYTQLFQTLERIERNPAVYLLRDWARKIKKMIRDLRRR